MSTPLDRDALREKFILALLEAIRPLQAGPDPELSLAVLIEAAGEVQERLQAELAELRIESD